MLKHIFNRKRRQGLALVTVLVMSTVMLMMVLSLYLASRGSLFASLQLQRRTAALYVAEAGLAETMEALEANAFVSPTGPLSGTLPGGGTWEVRFKTAGPFGDRDSN